MARRMIGYLHLHIIPEFQLYVSFLKQTENKTGGQLYAVAHICIVNSK